MILFITSVWIGGGDLKVGKDKTRKIRVKWRNLLPCKRVNVKKEEVGDTQKEKWFHSFPSFASVYFQCLSRNCDEALVSFLLKLSDFFFFFF